MTDSLARRAARSAPPFRPHPLLAGFNRQTLVAALLHGAPPGGRLERRVLQLDASNSVVAICHWQPRREAPALLLLHGLTGSADSAYMRRTARKAFAAGLHVVRLNARNCGDTEHLCATLYHAGLHEDPLLVAQLLVEEDGVSRMHVAGFSLGGNIALRLAASFGERPPPWLAGVTTVSASLDLAQCADHIDGTPSLLAYRRMYLDGLRRVLRRRAALEPSRRDLSGLDQVSTLRELDERWTAPEFGFSGAADYYARASSQALLGRVAVPALLIHSLDDEFVPGGSHERAAREAPETMAVLLTQRGGHCAFVGGARSREDGVFDSDRFWAENRIVRFAARTCGL
jgi:hypothetical protein